MVETQPSIMIYSIP